MTSPLSPAQAVLSRFAEGHAALLLTGRSLYDVIATEDGRLLTLVEHLRRHMRETSGMHMLTYSLAGGLDWDEPRVPDVRDRAQIEGVVRAHGLLDASAGPANSVRVLRGIAAMARAGSHGLVWANGTPMRFLFLFEFADHLAPSPETAGRTDGELAFIELAHSLALSHALRESGNLVLFHGRAGHMDALVSESMVTIPLRQPDCAEKHRFLEAARRLYANARFDGDLDNDVVARLTANTPNRGLGARLRASHRLGTPVTASDLLRQKSDDVVALSEGTLTLLDTRRVEGVRLVGRNIEVPLAFLVRFGEALLHGDSRVPSNIVLVGPPGTGKTDLALVAARHAVASAYQIHSPKHGIVGATELRSELMTRALAEWTPNVAFADEITELLPMERSSFDGDSGASRAVTGALLSALSDESRRGRSLLIGTTNCPDRMAAAMASRFTMIPVLSPLRNDYPAIVAAVAARVSPGFWAEPDSLMNAADTFYMKGASPREIQRAIGLALLGRGELGADAIQRAACDLSVTADRAAVNYADLLAIRYCNWKPFFPWHGQGEGYPLPTHLDGVVDLATGEVDRRELDRRIEALRPLVNL